MGSLEVRYRKKGTETWHHDRECEPKKYHRGKKLGYVMQKKCHHLTFKNREDAEERMKKLEKKLGKNYEFKFKRWGSHYPR